MNFDVRMVGEDLNCFVKLHQADVFKVSMRDITQNNVSMGELATSHNVQMEETSTALDARLKDVQIVTRTDVEPYGGSYEVTPTLETQTLQTENKLMERNVVINPIPSNYGLITWNGAVLTVS